MRRAGDIGADEGGEAPCFAHLLDEPEAALDDVVTAHVARSEGDCAGSGTGGVRGEARPDTGGSAPPRH